MLAVIGDWNFPASFQSFAAASLKEGARGLFRRQSKRISRCQAAWAFQLPPAHVRRQFELPYVRINRWV